MEKDGGRLAAFVEWLNFEHSETNELIARDA